MEVLMAGWRQKFFFGVLFLVALIGWAGYSPANAATLTVSNTNDSGSGSLRAAIAAAAPGDTINFSVTGAITLTTGELLIDKNLTISGPGASSLTIGGGGASRVFELALGNTATISGLTVTNGAADNGAGILVNSSAVLNLSNSVVSNNHSVTGIAQGGGITVFGTLNLSDSTISSNSATNGGGGLRVRFGATANVARCAITGNQLTAFGAAGAGIETQGTLSITNSTVSENSSPQGNGAGVSVEDSQTTMLNNTIAFNTSSAGAGANLEVLGGAGSAPAATIRNTIISNPVAGLNCRVVGSGTLTSNGYNLESTNTCGLGATGDITNSDPLLGPLALNTPGATMTHAILSGSPAIDTADPVTFPPTDQRGIARPQGPRADIGSYEFAALPPTAVPAMNGWGTTAFMLLIGLGAAYHLKRRKKEI